MTNKTNSGDSYAEAHGDDAQRAGDELDAIRDDGVYGDGQQTLVERTSQEQAGAKAAEIS